ncbi:hypothetical protein [Cryptosporangium arvum]|uniref:hypothetical protein n=1 Tax=Cryptosporangium arvum TaxID=80871 RepID=UPI0012EE9959|nr:hypothetical protein [Cryptosporangium arvum]
MTTTTVVAPPTSTNAKALAVVAGGVLFAVGNAMHPWEHNEAALSAPTWAGAHVVFATGAVLIAAGLGALRQRLARSKAAVVGLGFLWVALVLMPVSSYAEAYVAPAVGRDGFTAIEESTILFGLVSGLPLLIGPLLVVFGALRHKLLPTWITLSFLGTTLGLVLGPAVPKEGYAIIPGTVIFGLGVAAAGWLSRKPERFM